MAVRDVLLLDMSVLMENMVNEEFTDDEIRDAFEFSLREAHEFDNLPEPVFEPISPALLVDILVGKIRFNTDGKYYTYFTVEDGVILYTDMLLGVYQGELRRLHKEERIHHLTQWAKPGELIALNPQYLSVDEENISKARKMVKQWENNKK